MAIAELALASDNVRSTGIDLAKETVCVSISFGVFGNSRKLNPVALKIKGTAQDIHAARTLLDSPELETITSRDNEIRREAYAFCLPFDTGIHLVSRAAIPELREKLKDYETLERPVLVQRFLDAYPMRKDEAIEKLARLCAENGWQLSEILRPKDYPVLSEMRRRFYFEFSFLSLGVPDDLPANVWAEEKAKAESKWREATEEITAVMRQTLADLVSHLQERLTPDASGKPKILRDTAVTNLSEFLSTFDLRNVTQDSDLERLANECKRLLSGRSADMFRESDNLRSRVASDLASIKTSLDALVADKPTRKYRDD